MKKVIVVGSGGHAKVVIDILQEMKDFEIIGVTSNSLDINSRFGEYAVLGEDAVIKDFAIEGIYYAVMGLGGYRDNILRKTVFDLVKGMGMSFINAIHPSAIISKTAKLGEGVVIFPGVIINTDVQIGNNTIIATGSTIDHETIIGDHVLVSAGVTIGAYSKINDNAVIALGAKAVSGIIIGDNALVAAGAVVIKDVLPNETVYGIPAVPKNIDNG
jgi:UDP-perosamine 4-acetyltransferase